MAKSLPICTLSPLRCLWYWGEHESHSPTGAFQPAGGDAPATGQRISPPCKPPWRKPWSSNSPESFPPPSSRSSSSGRSPSPEEWAAEVAHSSAHTPEFEQATGRIADCTTEDWRQITYDQRSVCTHLAVIMASGVPPDCEAAMDRLPAVSLLPVLAGIRPLFVRGLVEPSEKVARRPLR